MRKRRKDRRKDKEVVKAGKAETGGGAICLWGIGITVGPRGSSESDRPE